MKKILLLSLCVVSGLQAMEDGKSYDEHEEYETIHDKVSDALVNNNLKSFNRIAEISGACSRAG